MPLVLPTVVALTLVLPTSTRAQDKPNFSGTWSMDHARSESAHQGENIGPVRVVISQSETELRIVTTRQQQTSTAVYKLDGSVSEIPGGRATAHWDGATLVIDTVLNVQGMTVTTKQSRHLEADGKELILQTVVAVQHGYTWQGAQSYGSGKDVFVKVPQG